MITIHITKYFGRVSLLVLIVFILSACGKEISVEVSHPNIEQTPQLSPSNFSATPFLVPQSLPPTSGTASFETSAPPVIAHSIIDDYFEMTKSEVLSLLGDNYEIIPTGVEGTLVGYSYHKPSLTFVFNQYDFASEEIVEYISGNESFEVIGVHSGMNFEEIQQQLGPSKIQDTFYSSPEHKAYEMLYLSDKCLYRFWSYSEDGSNAWLDIGRRRPPSDSNIPSPAESTVSMLARSIVDDYIEMTKSELLQLLGSSYKIVPAGVEGALDGYEYDELDLTFTFSSDDKVEFIWCGERFVVNGVHSGMSFAEVQNQLGSVDIMDTFYSSPEHKAYEIVYMSENCVYRFWSYEKDGKNSTFHLGQRPFSPASSALPTK